MKIEIDTKILIENRITVDQYIILLLLYEENWELLKSLYSYPEAIRIRDNLVSTKFILDKSYTSKFKYTVISRDKVAKLLGIKAEKVNFSEFYLEYPINVGKRILRPRSIDTKEGKKHEKQYLAIVKTIKDHEKAVASIKAYVASQKQVNRLMYLPHMGTVMNNALWQSWDIMIQEEGEEELPWNEETI